jgi:acetyltransferase-like isoleucine patch superfamily enzyme
MTLARGSDAAPGTGRQAIWWLRRVARRVLLDVQFVVLLCWYRGIGPPRVLCFDPEINVRLLRAFGAHVGEARVESPITLKLPSRGGGYRRLSIGDGCILNGNNYLDLSESITLEADVSLGPGVTVMTHNAFNANAFLETRLAGMVGKAPVLIKAGAGIKAHAVILRGVTIGEEAVVAGCALVNSDVPRRAFVVGVPAVVKQMLDEDAGAPAPRD